MIDLIGHTLNAVVFNGEEQTLSLTVDNDKIFLLKVDADCCSSGKFLGVKGSYDLPAKITAQHDRSESFQDGEHQVYETVLKLENGGKITINYYNESNGHYGSTLGAYYNGERLWDFPVEEAKNAGQSHIRLARYPADRWAFRLVRMIAQNRFRFKSSK